jgi:hypothetical protein
VEADPRQTVTIAPGGYGEVEVRRHGTLVLTAGTYTFDSFVLDRRGTLQIDSSGGPVVVYVQEFLRFAGVLTDVANPLAPDFLIGYAGNDEASVTGTFNGEVIAPQGTLTLGRGEKDDDDDKTPPSITGQFSALHLEVAPGTTITHRAYHCVP